MRYWGASRPRGSAGVWPTGREGGEKWKEQEGKRTVRGYATQSLQHTALHRRNGDSAVTRSEEVCSGRVVKIGVIALLIE